MGKKINVVFSDGTVRTVDEDLAGRLTGKGSARAETVVEEGERERVRYNEENTSALRAGLEGAADAVSFGGYGKLMDASGGGHEMRAAAEAHPTARTVGEVGALLAPTGLLGGTAKAASGFTAFGAAARTGGAVARAAGKGLGRVVEGGMIGLGAEVARTNVTGDPLTIEGALESATLGGILNYGFGVVGDKLKGASQRAQAAKATAEADIEIAKKAEMFKESPSYTEARASWNSSQATQGKLARQIEAETKAYNKFAGSDKKVKAAIAKVEQTINTLARPVDDAAAAATAKAPSYPGMAAPAEAPAVSKVSDEQLAMVKDFRARVSSIYQKQAGGWSGNPNKWTKAPGAPADPAGAVEDLRKLQDEIKQAFPKRSAKLDDIPPRPRAPIAHEKIDLPKSLAEFGKKHPTSVARLANSLDDRSKQWFSKVAEDVGLPAGTDVATLHGHVSDTLRAYEAATVRAAAAETKDAGSFVTTLRKMARNAAANMAGFKAFGAVGGGVIGAGAGAAARAGARAGMEGLETAALNNSLVAAKEGVRSKVRDVVAKYGTRIGSGAEKLGPVTAFLANSFPTGLPDAETDSRKRLVNRVNEMINVAGQAPDAMYLALQDTLGHEGDIAFKMHQAVVGSMNYLVEKAPKDPGIAINMFDSWWLPSHQQMVEFSHTAEATLAPMSAITRELRGDGHPAAVQALWDRWPAVMQEFSDELLYQVTTGQIKPTVSQASNYSRIFRVPLTGLQHPDVSALLQGMHAPPPQSNGPGQAGFGKNPQPVGRPPAVDSKVAGSSVAGLIAQ